MKENTIKAALAAALGALCAYGIQLLVPVLVLLVVMVLDYITGMAKAWHAGELSSRVGLMGHPEKVGYLVIVGVACVVDWLLRYGADEPGLELAGGLRGGLAAALRSGQPGLELAGWTSCLPASSSFGWSSTSCCPSWRMFRPLAHRCRALCSPAEKG